MTIFSILHLTDLHFGQPDHNNYFGGVEQQFFQDIRQTYENNKIGSWDVIIVGGDVAYSGRAEEFNSADRFFQKLLDLLQDLQSFKPPLIAVPGNHDLAWADALDPATIVLTALGERWPQSEAVWSKILGDGTSPFRSRIAECFANYTAWWAPWAQKIKSVNTLHLDEGSLPGDFTLTLTKGAERMGIVGLNSSFLQLTRENFEARLALHPAQFNAALPDKSLAWFDTLDAAVLLTHHPPEWLSIANKRQFQESIDYPGRFAVHLTGHLHKPRAEARSLDFSPGRRLVTGPSLFGFERASNDFDRIHGYGTIQIDIGQASSQGTIRYFPRSARKKRDGYWSFVRDDDFDLKESDGGTAAQNGQFQISQARIRSQLKEPAAQPPEPGPEQPPKPAVPPEIAELPEINAGLVSSRFVGRGRILEDFRSSLRELLQHDNSAHPSFANIAKLFWLHGFGGMGKSWFVRRACIEASSGAEGTCCVGLVDWHPYDWHRPASTPPRDAAEVFDAIAYRLTKLYGPTLMRDYWDTRARLTPKWPLHRQWHERLDEVLGIFERYGSEWKSHFPESIAAHGPPGELHVRLGKTAPLLESLGILNGRQEQVKVNVIRLRHETLSYETPVDGFFEQWATALSVADPEVARPTRALAESLGRCMRTACGQKPLLLALDTCEILSQHTHKDLLHDWLRFLLSPLVTGQVRILVIAASRDRADSNVLSRYQWRDLVDPLSFRFVDFDEEPFTRLDIKLLLEQQGVSSDRSTALARTVYDLTRGVPLAAATLLNSSNDSRDLEHLAWLEIDWSSELNRARALEKMYEVVTARFVLHLKGRPEDFRDVAALALLLRAEEEILGKLWRSPNPRQRLRELTERYTLLLDGDLHPTVRDFLRQHWRVAPPPELADIAMSLAAAHEETRPTDEAALDEASDWALERLNLLSWTKGEDAYPDFARAFVAFLALGEGIESLRSLACEIRPTSKSGSKLRTMLSFEESSWYFPALSVPEGVLTWIEREVGRSGDKREKAYLDILRGLRHNDARRYDQAVASLAKGLAALDQRVPRKDVIAHAYLSAVVGAGQRHFESAQEALRWCDLVGYDPDDEWDGDYYWVLHNSQYYERARAYCEKVLEADPDHAEARAFLGHIHAVHLRTYEEAERVFRRGIEKTPDNPTLHYFLADLLSELEGRSREAEVEYNVTLTHAGPDKDRARIKASLARLYLKEGRREEASNFFREAIKLDPTEVNFLNSYAWGLYLLGTDLAEASEMALEGFKLNPTNDNILHTYIAILVRINDWTRAAPLIPQWLARTSEARLISGWPEFVMTFRDAVTGGHGLDFAKLFSPIPRDVASDMVARALRGCDGVEEDLSSLAPVLQEAVAMLTTQISTPGDNGQFPPLA